jgi:HEAT repeat protein
MKSLTSLLLIFVASGPSASAANSSYELLLQKEKIAVTAEGIREYLRSLKPQDVSALRIAELISQLGDESFQKREAASKALGELSNLPVEKLKKAAEGEDAEIRFRAKQLLSGKQSVRPPITFAVLRMIQLKQIKGLTADLLTILPLIEKRHLEVAIRKALLTTMNPADEKLLNQALKSESSNVRKMAQSVLEIFRKKNDFKKITDDFPYQGLVA